VTEVRTVVDPREWDKEESEDVMGYNTNVLYLGLDSGNKDMYIYQNSLNDTPEIYEVYFKGECVYVCVREKERNRFSFLLLLLAALNSGPHTC
jgi:hypothetical protein